MTPEDVFRRFERDPTAFARIPGATYRLQLGMHLTFADVRRLVPYLASLGVSDCHLSPIYRTCSDRSHGYDVADHGRVNEALGSEADYHALAETLRAHGMGLIMDVVPNHMGIAGRRNAWWADVLENGPASLFAGHFDIDWDPIKPELKDKVLLPILGDQYGRVLENQELQLELDEGAFRIRYHDNAFPLDPGTYADVLGSRLDDLHAALGPEHPQLAELRSIITGLGHLPLRTERALDRREERHRETEIIKRRIAALVAGSAEIRAFVDGNVQLYNGVKGDASSFDRLDGLLARQAYRLSFWQTAGDEINYRRFFDINELAAIRVEEPSVFEAAHRLVFRLVGEGSVTGLRIDHPDGLFAPARYLRELERRCFLERARLLRDDTGARGDTAEWERAVLDGFDRRTNERDAAVRAREPSERLAEAGLGGRRRWWPGRGAGGWALLRAVQSMLRGSTHRDAPARGFYIVAEKILMPEEQLPLTWPVAGTTGYEFLNTVNGLFVDSAGARSLFETYAQFVGARPDFAEVACESKRLVMDTTMASEMTMLGRRLGRISERRRSARDFTDRMLTEALREIVACFPVYRTYISTDNGQVTERDRRYVEVAVAEAQRRNPSVSASVFEFIRSLLCLELPADMLDLERAEVRAFVGRFQQLTGPFTAKGIEDTAFYRYHCLISLNEVGGHPTAFGIGLQEFHERCLERAARWPHALSVLSTHDTKRGEDVRARINALSELPHEWRAKVRTWHRWNRGKKAIVDGAAAPDKNDEYLLYQTLLGAWPTGPLDEPRRADFVERMQAYMHKALREAKIHVSWINPRPQYDDAVRRFIANALDPVASREFLEDFGAFQARIAEMGVRNSLAQTVLRLAAPGVPELYQGAELWELHLVDPDNRRPVDFGRREALLGELRAHIEAAAGDLARLARALFEERHDGRVKLYLILRGLAFRRQHPRLFQRGDYVPLAASGAWSNTLCAFARTHESDEIVVAVPRSASRLIGAGGHGDPAVWGEEVLNLQPGSAGRVYRNLFTGETVESRERDGRPALELARVFASLPVAILERAQNA
jgi:(1->4)-alpha-D-glucan 1-alpha-D-glucosylmutase